MDNRYYEGVGRRKQSSARVRVMAGSGVFTVNGKEIEAFFTPWATIGTRHCVRGCELCNK